MLNRVIVLAQNSENRSFTSENTIFLQKIDQSMHSKSYPVIYGPHKIRSTLWPLRKIHYGKSVLFFTLIANEKPTELMHRCAFRL